SDDELNEKYAAMIVRDASTFDPREVDLVFNAIESDAAKILEPRYAVTTPVVSTASAFRYFDDTPMIIPGVNNDHVSLLKRQQSERGWKGFVTPIPNCTTTGLVSSLAPIFKSLGVDRLVMTSMQAMSGAGRRGGVLGLDALDNVIPYIPGEEEKVQKEAQKILGKLIDGKIIQADFPLSATCTRVAVLDAHTEAIYVATTKATSAEEVAELMRNYDTGLQGLPTEPRPFIKVHDDPFRPQPRRDRNNGGGMTTSVGRLRAETAIGEHGIKYVAVSHNTKAGAAKGAILVAELLQREGWL
ncbi:MAG: aspartate-semialdehyde dehydrogenase, partial [Abditibacteriaceae bacterium]